MVRTAIVSIVCFAVTLATSATLGHARVADQALPEVLVSRQLAEAFSIAAGGVVRFSTGPSGENPREFRVAGIYEPVPDPMRINASKHEVRLHLPDLLEMTADPADPLSAQTVDAINIALARPDEARTFAREVAARIPGIVARVTPLA